jgi:hypothetical protein
MHGLRIDVGDPQAIRIFLSLFVFQDYAGALLMLAVMPLALSRQVQTLALEVTAWCGHRPVAVAGMTFIGLAVAAQWAYHAHPLSMDEYSATFQARVFASGNWHGQLPPSLIDWLVPEGFQGHFLEVSHVRGLVASVYWPGWALILTPFAAAGVPWLANPTLGGLAVYLVHRLVFRLTTDSSAAGLAAFLTIASPAFSVNAFSFYSMNAHLVCNVAFTLLLLNPTALRALAAGFVGSLALVLHNPVPHMLYALPWILWLLFRKDRFRVLPAMVAGYLPLCVGLGIGWPQVIALLTEPRPVSALVQPSSAGFLASLLDRVQHTFRAPGLDLLEDRLMGVTKLWLWAVPGLPLIAVLGVRALRADVRYRLMTWSAISTLVGFLFVPFDQGHGWGFRYFHSVWFCLPVLAAAQFRVHRSPEIESVRNVGNAPTLRPFIAACTLLSLVILTPFRVWQVERFVAGHLAQVPAVSEGSPRLVLVQWRAGYYAADLVQNDPFLRDEPIYMIARGETVDRKMLATYFPDLVLLAESPTARVFGTREP